MFELDRYGYTRDEQTGIWVRSDYQGIAYSDGDKTENKLAAIVRDAEDVSVLSEELPQHCTDWATLYHLSSIRGNILRPFEHLLKGKVLEIGAGCGAISRFLGECGAQLLSLEGSPRRASIAASRTRGLENVTVLAERFDDFKTDEQFDTITLIGVLEYASMFSKDADPAYTMLRRIRELLKPDGHLFIAIENQLGLKYFAGAPEDHLNIPMYGIEGRYTQGQPKTYGRNELERLIERAGFSTTTFMSPLPDYKMPNSIITEAGYASQLFDAAALSCQNVRKDRQLPNSTHFDLEKSWPVVIENDLGMTLANSFLVAASNTRESPVDENILAYHYSTGRRSVYCKASVFRATEQGIEVHYNRFADNADADADDNVNFKHVLPSSDRYVKGDVLSRDFLLLAARPDWSAKDFHPLMARYVSILLALSDKNSSESMTCANTRLPGHFIDAVPQNIIIDATGSATLIDIEWQLTDGVELGHLLLRGLLLLMPSLNPQSHAATQLTRQSFVSSLLESVAIHLNPDDIDRYVQSEARFQQEVTGRQAELFLNWHPEETIGEVQASVPIEMLAILYFGTAEGDFVETAKSTQVLQHGRQSISFDLTHRSENQCLLRFDPVNAKEAFIIHSITIISSSETIWASQNDFINFSGVSFVPGDHDGLLFVSLNDDPNILLPVRLDTLQDLEPVSLIVDLTLLTKTSTSTEILTSISSSSMMAAEKAQLNEELLNQQQARIQELENRLALLQHQKDTHTQELESRLALLQCQKDTHIQELESRLALLQSQKDTHIHDLNLNIISMQSSTSWKITAPLRRVLRIAKRLRKTLRVLPAVIRKGGGFKSTVKKTMAVWREQGTRGLIERLRWLNRSSQFEFVGQETREVTDRNDYLTWVKYYDTLDDNCRERIKEDIRTWNQAPLISIIMPVYNPPLELLQEAVTSVLAQLYPNWQLCIADDASTDPQVIEYLESLSSEDERINVTMRSENGHISQASSTALESALGSYIALMDNDDLLPEHALYWVARAIIENPGAGLIYSDEDKIDNQGTRSSPYFKSEWNEFLFRSQNMICHLGVYRRDLIEQVGGFRVGFEGAQDYDLALRCSEQLAENQIVHIPRVLYHWRIHVGSTAMAGDEKPYAALAGVKALDEHLQRKGNIGKTELLPRGMYRTHYALPAQLPLVSLIIPTRNAYALVKQCIDSIKTLSSYRNFEIILIDNGSDDPESLAYFSELGNEPNITVLHDDGPFNYSALNNRAVREARGELIGLINNDIEVITPEWLEEMVAIALQPSVGAVGARLWYPDDRLQHGGVLVGLGGVAGHSHKYLPKGDLGYFCRAALIQEFSAVTAACLIIKKSIFDEVGGLDEVNLKVAFNDVDFCLRVQEAGYKNVWTPFAELYHHESATRGLENTPQKQERFMKEVNYMKSRWPDIQNDRAYSPNLTLNYEDFSLAWPPRVEF
ncbi:glycosyltransferase [Pseudomonas sp. NPDC087804]|uniref:glycosyltransferase n=1 Tax=Pseudomonas sp. NPDC087804 TaxID=3364449 RepID=UPI0037FA2246